jgi:hypothetical protein
MKTKINQAARLGLTAALAAVSLGLAASRCSAAAFDSPASNDWDCLASGGGQDGIYFLSFSSAPNGDGTFPLNGVFIAVGQKSGADSGAVGRNFGGDQGRGGFGSGGSNSIPVVNVFGGGPFTGHWSFDGKGRIFGAFTITVNAEGVNTNFNAGTLFEFIDAGNGDTTNIVINFADGQASATTNITWTDPTPFTNSYTFANPNTSFSLTGGITNSVSFTGTVTPGKRITLTASSSFGRVNYRGIPLVQNLDLNGSLWTGIKHQDKVDYNEIFTLSNLGANVYGMDGTGPAYTYNSVDTGFGPSSFCLVSSQGRIGFCVVEFPIGDDVNGVLRATIGGFNTKNISAKTAGVTVATDGKIHFQAAALP